MEDRIQRIRQKLLARPKRLNPPLSERAIETFEAKHQVVLPSAYRVFLLQIGNGGDGPPDFGLQQLGEAADDMAGIERETWTALPFSAKPFPFTKPWIWEDGEGSSEGTREQVEHGSLCLGTDGCAAYWHLIVTGPEQGNVWLFADVGITPTVPRRDFLQWYEDWLDGIDVRAGDAEAAS